MTKTTEASSRRTLAKPTKTSIRKSLRSTEKTVAKKETVTKNDVIKSDTKLKKGAISAKVEAKVTRKTKVAEKTIGNSNILELCLLLDCTGSMGSWIQRSKDTLK